MYIYTYYIYTHIVYILKQILYIHISHEWDVSWYSPEVPFVPRLPHFHVLLHGRPPEAPKMRLQRAKFRLRSPVLEIRSSRKWFRIRKCPGVNIQKDVENWWKLRGLPQTCGLIPSRNGDKEASLAWSPHILSQESPMVRVLISCHWTTTGTRSYITLQWIYTYTHHFTRSHILLTEYLVYDTLYIYSIHTYIYIIHIYIYIHTCIQCAVHEHVM